MINKQGKILCTHIAKGKVHDFKLFLQSLVRPKPETTAEVDKGYQGLQKLHAKTKMPKKATKTQPLTQEEKRANKELASSRISVEHAIRRIKVFKIFQTRYRNRRRRFGLRFNLVCGLVNYDLGVVE